MLSGARVRNAYETCPSLGDNLSKERLIPHKIVEWHHSAIKTPVVKDGHASN
jgi:hypothetical protein